MMSNNKNMVRRIKRKIVKMDQNKKTRATTGVIKESRLIFEVILIILNLLK